MPMRVEVIYGENSADLTNKTNSWLEGLAAKEVNKVVLSISPAMPRDRDGGGYITIIYTDKETVFEKIQ